MKINSELAASLTELLGVDLLNSAGFTLACQPGSAPTLEVHYWVLNVGTPEKTTKRFAVSLIDVQN